MQKALHFRYDVERLYMYQEIEDSVDASIQMIKDNIEMWRGRLIAVTRNNADNTSIKQNRNNI